MKYRTCSNSRAVFSTEAGRIDQSKASRSQVDDDNKLLTLRRETKKRGGKTVIVINGCPTSMQSQILKKLKGLCACGGSIKDDNLEIQVDHRDKIQKYLEQQGFTVKLTGG